LAVDALTVHPFLGFESLRPLLDAASLHGAGVFVLALTSNPEGHQVQHARTGASTVAGEILAAIRAENAGASPLGSVGAVVGANLPSLEENVDVNGPLLAPGYGAQGGTVDNMRRIFGPAFANTLPSTSRGVLAAGPDVAALRAAANRCLDELT
jgi:orotidine-5'-phosphate decarboxylase